MKKALGALFGPDPLTTIIGLVAGIAVYAADAIKALPDIGPGWQVLAAILVTVGRVLNTRGKAPPAAAALALLAAGSLFAAPARAAGPGVYCIKGCDGMARLGGRLGAAEDTQISGTVWAGPGLGVIPFRYNGATHEWSNPAAPAVSYGLWWRPPGYSATKSLAAVNLSLTGEFSGKSHIDPLVTLTLFDNFTIGGGPQINFETGGQRSGVNAVFAIGWQTSLGAP